ncbi:MAG TPA: phosphoribosylformylglycinamidine synthase I [Candidatus Lustribacter sp.]
MKPRIAVVLFPGTNSENETQRALAAAGLDAEIVHWSRGSAALRAFDAYVLPGGFAYEDRVRAGAVAAHDEAMDAVIAGAQAGKFVIGICNGAQVLLEAGLVPGTGPLRRPTAAFAPNASGRFQSVHVHVRLAVAPARVPVLAGLASGAVLLAWASHGEGRLAASATELDALERDGHVAFVYCNARGERVPAPNGSAREIAGLTNRDGNVLAIMPHPERDAWTFMHRDGDPAKAAARGDAQAMLAPSGGMAFFEAFAAGLAAAPSVR